MSMVSRAWAPMQPRSSPVCAGTSITKPIHRSGRTAPTKLAEAEVGAHDVVASLDFRSAMGGLPAYEDFLLYFLNSPLLARSAENLRDRCQRTVWFDARAGEDGGLARLERTPPRIWHRL